MNKQPPSFTVRPFSLDSLAADYCNTLDVGSTIDEASDGPFIRPFRHLIPGMLSRRGLVLEPIEGGFVVVTAPWYDVTDNVFADATATGPKCPTCGESWMSCGHAGEYRFYWFSDDAVMEPRGRIWA